MKRNKKQPSASRVSRRVPVRFEVSLPVTIAIRFAKGREVLGGRSPLARAKVETVPASRATRDPELPAWSGALGREWELDTLLKQQLRGWRTLGPAEEAAKQPNENK
jgi:hypothetical protein